MTACNALARGSMAVLSPGQTGTAVAAEPVQSNNTISLRTLRLFEREKSDIANTRQIKLYQDQATFKRDLCASIAEGCLRIVGQAPTAFGKTVLAAAMARDILDRGKRMIFVVHALSLIDQTVARFIENGIDAGLIGVLQADHPMTDPDAPIQIASVCTLQRREIPPADLVCA